MNNKNIIITGFSLGFGLMCFIWGVLWMMMCLDYKHQTIKLEQSNADLKWQLSEISSLCGGNDVK